MIDSQSDLVLLDNSLACSYSGEFHARLKRRSHQISAHFLTTSYYFKFVLVSLDEQHETIIRYR